jgi:DNA-binding NtrC family response regulator
MKEDRETTEAGEGKPKPRVYIVDDDPNSCNAMAVVVRQLGLDIRSFTDPLACMDAVDEASPDIVITDLKMPRMSGLQVLERVKQSSPTTDVVVVTGDADKINAMRALKLGAFDMFEKPVIPDALIATLKRTLAYRNLQSERDRYAEQVSFLSHQEAAKWGLEALVGESKTIRRIVHDIRLLHRTGDTAVLVTGESGTGKELVARAVHYGGPRAGCPFVPINCCAVPGELWESVFFGHTRGSFTGATADKKGCFETADKGSLFLDEIGDMPVILQTKLLRVLEDGVIMPVGATRGRCVDVRIIASTNADLAKRIQDGGFRSDLYHRLAVFTIAIPPLRERLEDIPLLARHFLSRFAEEMGHAKPVLSDGALQCLTRYPFPGNVRELRNLIEQALIRSEGGAIGPEHFRLDAPAWSDRAVGAGVRPVRAVGTSADAGAPLNLRDAEATLIRRAVQEADGNLSRAARLLGINRTRLYRKLTQFHIDPGSADPKGLTG